MLQNIYIKLFYTFFKIGLFTVGGGYAMIPLIQQEIVNHGWMDLQEIIDIIAISEMTPGPFAINAATFIGIKTTNLAGAALSTGAVALPSFMIVILVARYFAHFKDHPVVQSVLYGLRPAVIGLIASAAFIIAKSTFVDWVLLTTGKFSEITESLNQVINWRAILIFAVVMVGSKKYKLHPIILIVISAVLGMILFGLL